MLIRNSLRLGIAESFAGGLDGYQTTAIQHKEVAIRFIAISLRQYCHHMIANAVLLLPDLQLPFGGAENLAQNAV